MGNTSIIEHIPVWGSFECFLIVKDAVLECLNLLHKAAILDCSVSLMINDGCKESVCNDVKELGINVWVRSEGGLSGSW